MHLLRDLTADGRPLSDDLCGAVAVALVRMRRVGEAEVFLGDLDKRGAVLGDQVPVARDFPDRSAVTAVERRPKIVFTSL